MDENNKINEKSTNKLIYNGQSESNAERISENDVQNMRFILPAFIQNERKYSQSDRRKIQSSPIKSKRRFSQDSAFLSKHINNVSNKYMFCFSFIHSLCKH